MPFAKRVTLVSDDPLAIVVGGRYVCALPIELFRAVSKRDDEIDMDHPNGPAFFLPDTETWPICELVVWARQLVEKEDYARLGIMRDNNHELCTFRDLSLVRAGKMLGMDLYVNEMFCAYVDHINHGAISLEDVDDVVRLALTKNDIFLSLMGARLGELVLSGVAFEVFPWLESYLEDHAWLKFWVVKKVQDEEDAVEKGQLERE